MAGGTIQASTESDNPPRLQRPAVLLVAQAAPALGGIPSFVGNLMEDQALARDFDMRLLNTTRAVERRAGTLSLTNLSSAVVDTARTYRQSRSCEVVHVQTALMPTLPLLRALALCAAARLAGSAVICHVHSGRVNSGQEEAFAPRRMIRLLLRCLRVCDLICTVSNAGTRTLVGLVPGVDVQTVDNAVDVERFVLAHPIHLPCKLLYVGTLSRRKGLLDLVSALHLLVASGVTGWTLEVVGGSAEVGEHEAEQIRQALRDEGLADSMIGSLDGDEVRARLATADVFVLPSHWEGQPIAILEAMAAGLPVVATTVGANPDVIRNGMDGLLVRPHGPDALSHALQRIIEEPELRERMGASARQRVMDNHSMAVLGRRLTPLYRQAISHRRMSRKLGGHSSPSVQSD